MLQLQVLTDRQLESRTSLGDTNLTIGSSSFEGTLPAAPSTNLTNGAILDTEEELAEAEAAAEMAAAEEAEEMAVAAVARPPRAHMAYTHRAVRAAEFLLR